MPASDAELLVLTLRGSVLEAGSAWAQLLGRPVAELETLSLDDLLDDVDRRILLARIGALAGDEGTWRELRITVRGRDGRPVHVDAVGSFMRRDGGSGTFVLLLSGVRHDRDADDDAVLAAWRRRSLVLLVQAIRDADTLELVRRELLVRLRLPSGGLLPAEVAVPALTRLGLLGELDVWVTAAAAPLLEQPPPLEINLGRDTLEAPAAVLEVIRRDVLDAGRDPQRLVLCLRATDLIARPDAARTFLRAARELGCCAGVDGAGRHLDRAAELLDLPVDLVKVTADLAAPLARVAAGLDHPPELAGERVATPRALDAVRQAGLRTAQGYHLGLPRRVSEG
jgi:EAL domain-containing protein (putative c-di-GMP-specific phosphodiesterase class I)